MEAMPFTSSGTSRAHRLRSLIRPPKWKALRKSTAAPTGFPKKLSNIIVSADWGEFKGDVPRCLAIFTLVVVEPERCALEAVADFLGFEEDALAATLVAGVVLFMCSHIKR